MLNVRLLTLSAALLSMLPNAQAANFSAPAPAIPGVTAPAPGTKTFKDWRVEERASSESSAGVCIAATTALLGTVKENLEVIVDKSGVHPVELRVRPEGDLPGLVGLKATVDKKVFNFALVASVDAGRDVLWQVPRGTEDLIAILKRDLKLETVAVDGTAAPQKASFSLRGSTDALNELAKRCNGNKGLGETLFERAFLPAIVATVDISKLTPAMTDSLRQSLAQALAGFRTSAQTQTAIQALVAKYLTSINELSKLQSNLDTLQNKTVVDLTNRRTSDQALIVTVQGQIDQLTPQIAVNEAKLTQANANYEAAYNVLQPLMAKHDSLSSDVDSADSDVSAASKRVNDIDSGISQLQSQISSLQSELSSVNSQINSARSDAQNLDARAAQAYRDDANFDTRSEIQRQENSDWTLSNLENQLRSLDQRARDAQNRADQARNRLSQAQSRYSGIQSQMQSAQRDLDRASSSREHALDGLRQCQDAHQPDCSAAQSALAQAEAEVNNARSEVASVQNDYNRAQSELSSMQSDVDSAERDAQSAENDKQGVNSQIAYRIQAIESSVQSQKDQLDSAYSSAKAQADQADQRVNDLQSRAQQIANSDLPTAQSNLSSWSQARPGAVSDLRSAQQESANADAALSAYERQVGWDAKAAAVSNAQDVVDSIKSTLSDIDTGIKARQKQIASTQADLADIQTKMDAALDAIRTKQARSVEVQTALQPYDQQRAVLDQQKAAADQAFAGGRSTFAANLPQ